MGKDLINSKEVKTVLVGKNRNTELSLKTLANGSKYIFRNCHTIAFCPEAMHLDCKAFKEKKSCWFFFGRCMCPVFNGVGCETCLIYRSHLADLRQAKEHIINGLNYYVLDYLEHLKPLLDSFIPGDTCNKSSILRRKKAIANIAVKLLKMENQIEGISFEKYLFIVYKEIFG